MPLGGTYQDHYKDMFKGLIGHQAQQKGSRLEQTVSVEAMEGNKTYFEKLGSVSPYIKTTRNQDKNFADITFERRQVTETPAEFDHLFDRNDLVKYVENPQNDVVSAAVYSLGRQKDKIIRDALKGNAVVTTEGSTANQALTQTVAVNNHSFDSGTGDVGLTTGKLRQAKTLINAAYGAGDAEEMFCVGPIRQIMNLTTDVETVSSDYREKKALEGPGIVDGISGYLGINFVAYEDTGVDSSADELVYVYTKSAVKLGVFTPLTVSIDKIPTKSMNPDCLSVWESIGATRMWEEAVVEIACDPLA